MQFRSRKHHRTDLSWEHSQEDKAQWKKLGFFFFRKSARLLTAARFLCLRERQCCQMFCFDVAKKCQHFPCYRSKIGASPETRRQRSLKSGQKEGQGQITHQDQRVKQEFARVGRLFATQWRSRPKSLVNDDNLVDCSALLIHPIDFVLIYSKPNTENIFHLTYINFS